MGKGTKPPAAPPDSISLHRKLDPIYECVDTGQNKAALRLIGDLLKKYPTLQIARVLKGITLSRMGREDEGMDLCEEVRAEGPADDTVLNTLALFYKNVGAAQQQVEMFERASERDPRNTEHLTLLFQAYARAYDFVKQQQCAMKLYRLTNNPKHVMWAVCAMLMQAEANPTALALAAGMCSKLEAKGSIADRESLLVYARVLRECGKGEKALELLGGALGTKCVPMAAERANLCAVQAAAFGQNGETMRHWRDLLTHAPDDWIAMSSAMDIAMPATNAAVTHRPQVPAGGTRMAPDAHVVGGVGTVKVGSSSSDLAKLLGRVALEPSNDDTGTGTSTEAALNAGRTLVDEIRAASDGLGGAFKAGRGAYLLAVEFAYRSVQSPAGSPLGSLGDAMASYWAQFGTWTSCARDLRPYCDAIVRTDPGVAKALGDKFVEEANALPEAEGGSDGKEAQRRLRRVIAAHAISAQLGQNGGSWRVTAGDKDVPPGLARPSLGHCEGRARAATAMHLYRNSKPAFAGPDPREPTPADTAALLATQALCAEATGHAVLAAKGTDESAKDGSLRGGGYVAPRGGGGCRGGNRFQPQPRGASARSELRVRAARRGDGGAGRLRAHRHQEHPDGFDDPPHLTNRGGRSRAAGHVPGHPVRGQPPQRGPAGHPGRVRQGVRERGVHEGVGVRGLSRASSSVALVGGGDGGEGPGDSAGDVLRRRRGRRGRAGGGAGPGDGRAGLRGDGVSIADCHVANREVQRGFGDQPRVGAADARVERARRPGLVAGSRRLGPKPRVRRARRGCPRRRHGRRRVRRAPRGLARGAPQAMRGGPRASPRRRRLLDPERPGAQRPRHASNDRDADGAERRQRARGRRRRCSRR